MKAHCLFEQSGTFKNEFIKLGIDALDYDILNNYGQTDFQIDLFHEIELGYENKPSIFDNINQEDIVMTFFPCVRFEAQISMHFKGTAYQLQKLSQVEKLEKDLILEEERAEMYELITKLAIICLKKGFPMVIENPYCPNHYLKMFWSLPCTIIDTDRTKNGDYFIKPTQYWFLNCEPKNNILSEAANYNGLGIQNVVTDMKKEDYLKMGAKTKKEARSMIHPDYANIFIRQFIL